MPDFTLIKHSHRGYGVYTKIGHKRKDKVFVFDGEILPTYLTNKNSMKLTKYFSLQWLPGRAQCYFNHSCNPNCYFDFSTGTPILTALRDIIAHEELNYNYNTVEADLKNKFNCHCADKNCLGRIQGFMYLTPKMEEGIMDQLSPYIRELQSEYEKNRD